MRVALGRSLFGLCSVFFVLWYEFPCGYVLNGIGGMGMRVLATIVIIPLLFSGVLCRVEVCKGGLGVLWRCSVKVWSSGAVCYFLGITLLGCIMVLM